MMTSDVRSSTNKKLDPTAAVVVGVRESGPSLGRMV
jgi:hypothetical protein